MSVRIRSVRPAFSGGGFAGSRTGLTFARAVPLSIPLGNVRIDFFRPAAVFFLSVGVGGGGLPPTFTIFTPDIFACIYVARFHTARLLREVLLKKKVHVIRNNPKLLIENVKTRGRRLSDILGRVNSSEEVDDELHV